MVFFTCNHCGESLKKAAVEKHYNFKCRGAKKNISCMDCQKDFYGEEYAAHIKCITEAEKYSGKDYVPKEQKNNGQKKQESWMEIVRSILDTKDLSNEMKSAFHKLKAVENVPRKKAKFINFVSNSMRMRANQAEQIWAVLDEELTKMKQSKPPTAEQNKSDEPKETEKEVDSTETEKTTSETASQPAEAAKEKKVKKSKKRKVDKQVQNTIEEDEEEEILQMVEETVKKDEVSSEPKKKKSKKRDEAAISKKGAIEAEQEPTVSTTTPDEFEWGLIMEYTVRKYADGINLDKLKRKVNRMYLNKRGVAALTEKEKLKFDKKYTKYIKKCNFKVESGIVRVAEQVD